MPTDTSADHLPCSCNVPEDPQPTMWGRKWGRRDHGLTQHSFLYGRTKGKDLTQAAAPLKCSRSRAASLLQPRIRDMLKGVFGQTHSRHQLPLGGFYLLQGVAVQIHTHPPLWPSLHWKQGYPQDHDEWASIRAWHMPGVLIHGKRKGESVVWVWRQSGLEQLLRAKILLCNGFINCSVQTYWAVTPLGAETHWERDLLSQVTLPETSDTI